MSRSRKKVCAGMIACGCKSRKKGKKVCHKKFRMSEKNGKPLHRMREAMDPWDLGGDGKMVYTFNKNSEEYKKYTRK